jgi:hypothetical protein
MGLANCIGNPARCGDSVAGGVWAIQRTTQRAVQPVSDMASELTTQVARILHPTPTVLPDPVTIINQIRPLARLETIQYTVEKVITAEVGQNSLAPLFGDKLLFVGHGYVTAGIDLQDIESKNFVVEDGVIRVQLPGQRFRSIDNDKSYVYAGHRLINTGYNLKRQHARLQNNRVAAMMMAFSTSAGECGEFHADSLNKLRHRLFSSVRRIEWFCLYFGSYPPGQMMAIFFPHELFSAFNFVRQPPEPAQVHNLKP